MELKYVGAKPIVSQHGVSFDQNRPDKYILINSAVELLEALNSDLGEDSVVKLTSFNHKELNGKELAEKLKLYCSGIDEVFNTREAETEELIENYKNSVEQNRNITNDEKTAWLGNIRLMRDYYLQYITNENAYNVILNTLADTITSKHIEEIQFPVGRNYGLVLGDLVTVLTDHKPPIDAKMSFEDQDGEAIGRLILK
ncbi:hypothetical protein MNB_SV-6-973 [hydrothermal vent metagenome]|uniref:Uncharacterized protein n=1 Tax=hydrothermal vent metagenome TaxID=652676 RepID=A0A1W1C6N1_9ZZZZ